MPEHVANMKSDELKYIDIENPDFEIAVSLAYKVTNDNTHIPLFLKQSGKVIEK